MKLVIALMAAVALTTGFTCSKNTPEEATQSGEMAPPPAQEEMGAPAETDMSAPADDGAMVPGEEDTTTEE